MLTFFFVYFGVFVLLLVSAAIVHAVNQDLTKKLWFAFNAPWTKPTERDINEFVALISLFWPIALPMVALNFLTIAVGNAVALFVLLINRFRS